MIVTVPELGVPGVATNRAGLTSENVVHRRRLALITPAERAEELFERYPDLRLLRGCDWQRLGVTTVFSLLFGAASRHFANLQLAAVLGILSTAGVTRDYKLDADHCIRTMLDLVRKRFGISTPQDITLEMWEEWGQDTELIRTLTDKISKYAAAVNFHTPAYVERLSRSERDRSSTCCFRHCRITSANVLCQWLSIERPSGDGGKRKPTSSVNAPLPFWL
jgi:hypothetical protein